MEPIYVQPRWATVHLIHCLLAVAGSLVAAAVPPLGFALVLAAGGSLYLDLDGRAYLLRRLLFRRASQNVISPPLPTKPAETSAPAATVFLCAHYDAPLTGAAYGRRPRAAFQLLRRIWPARTTPAAVLFWSIVLLLPALGLRMAGFEGLWVALLQLPPTLVLVVAAFVLGEIALSPPSPAANDNAAGVAAAILAAKRLRAEPPALLEVRLLLCGAGESTRQGVRSFIRAHRGSLDRDRTWFIDIDSPGIGEPRYVALEIPVLGRAPDRELAELAQALADTSERGLRPLALGPAGAASMAAAHRYPALALTSRLDSEFVPANHHTALDRAAAVDPAAIDAVAAVACELVQLIDRDLARKQRATGSRS